MLVVSPQYLLTYLIKQNQASSKIYFNCGKIGHVCKQPQTKENAAIPRPRGKCRASALDVGEGEVIGLISVILNIFKMTKYFPTGKKQDVVLAPGPANNRGILSIGLQPNSSVVSSGLLSPLSPEP